MIACCDECGKDAIQLLFVDTIGRHQIDGVAQWPQQEAMLQEEGAKSRREVRQIARIRCDDVDRRDRTQLARIGEGG